MRTLTPFSVKNSKNYYDNIYEILDDDLEFTKNGKKGTVLNSPCAFDIEASSFYIEGEKKCCMYAWVLGINGKCIRGRTWKEFLYAIDVLTKFYNCSLKKRIIIYVHNLSYEFQWFHKYFEWEKVFATDERKPLYAITKNGIEFRCSYLLSGYSLEVLGDNLTKYKIKKMVGDLDYKLIRHSKTELTEKEWGYILHDALVVMCHIQEEIERLGSITKIPLTKTGYVRNLCKEKCLQGENRFDFVKRLSCLTLTEQTYLQLKRTYTGGFTHANINYVDKVIQNVHSFDFSSSYPAVMLAEMYPMSYPKRVYVKSSKQLYSYLNYYCCMFDVRFTNLCAKVNYENYISKSRCSEIENYYLNNGRVVEAETLTMSVTEQDFFIIAQLYEWDNIEIGNFYVFEKDYLPKDLILTILELYKDKTELKGIEDKIVEYLVSKGMINSIYGMCVTDPCKDDIIYECGEWQEPNKADIPNLIDKYNKNRQRTLYYPWGVWVTAYARRNLFSGICEFQNDYIYSDTDSIKVVNIENHMEYIKKYNKEVTEKIYKCLDRYGISHDYAHPKTIKGIEKPIGVWDYEGMYDRFKTLGAKRYMTEENGEISITIAGVNKKAGIKYLKWKYGDNDNIFDNFVDGLHFPAHYDDNGIDENGSGKLCHTYIDNPMCGVVKDYKGEYYIFNEESGVHMENTDYTLGLEFSFIKLLMGIREGHIV